MHRCTISHIDPDSPLRERLQCPRARKMAERMAENSGGPA